MSYLRFTPEEYRVLRRLYRPLEPTALKCLLLASLKEFLPELAGRVARFTRNDLRLLRDHFRARQPREAVALTDAELRAVAEVLLPFPFLSRFTRYLRRSLVRQLGERFPGLAAKIARMNDAQFRSVYERARGKGSPGQ